MVQTDKCKKGVKISRTTVLSVILSVAVVISAFFITDTVRTKKFGIEPIFCVKLIEYESGSIDYYGLGYKIWYDRNMYDGTESYSISLWILPKFISF